MNLQEIPVVILCGGNGVFMDGSGTRRSKGLVKLRGEALVVHLMRHFCRAGSRRFILCCGYQMDLYLELFSSLGVQEGSSFRLEAHGLTGTAELVDTGLATPTGGRLRKVAPLLQKAPWFWVTYSDTLSNVNLRDLAQFHLDHGRVASCLAARLPTRFRILGMRRGEGVVRGFSDQPVIQSGFINGGFYALQPEIFQSAYLGDPTHDVFEESVLDALVEQGQLDAFPHEGHWQYFDCERDLAYLSSLVDSFEEAR